MFLNKKVSNFNRKYIKIKRTTVAVANVEEKPAKAVRPGKRVKAVENNTEENK